MKNIDNCPEELLLLIETKDFSDLKKSEKEMVFMYLTEEEYKEFRLSLQVLSLNLNEVDNEEIPAVFHKQFELKKEKKSLSIQIQAWQLAASLILIGGLWIWTLKLKSNTEPMVQINRDTIYLSNNTVPQEIKIYDTIFISKTIIKERKASKIKKDTVMVTNEIRNENYQIEQLNALRNKRKNKGIKGDSLLKNFEFVRI